MGYQNGSISYPDFQKKLFIYDEFGHFLSIPRKLPEDQFDDPTVVYNNCADFMFKQDLWFTLASGCAVAGLDWWNNDQVDRYKMWEKYFTGLKSFVADIDFENVNFNVVRETKGNLSIAQRWPLTEEDINRSNSKAYRKSDLLEAYTQVSKAGDLAFGWMSNRSVHPYNLLDAYPCLAALYNGTEPFSIPYLYPPKDDDLVDKPINIEENEYYIKIYHLQKNEKYEIGFYNTISGELINTKNAKTNNKGTLKLMSPDMDLLENPDLAYKVKLVK
jgi:hypothetical protein